MVRHRNPLCDLHVRIPRACVGLLALSVTTAFTLIPFVLNWKTRLRFPGVLPFYIALGMHKLFASLARSARATHSRTSPATHILGWSYVGTLINGFERTFCEKPWRAAAWKHAPCTIQGTDGANPNATLSSL